MDQAWWFPAVAPLPGKEPAVMLAERSLPGWLIVDQNGVPVRQRVSGLHVVRSAGARTASGPAYAVESMWIVFDQKYRNSYVFAGELFPRMPIPQSWYDGGNRLSSR